MCVLLLFVYVYLHLLVCIFTFFKITSVITDLQFLSVPKIQKKPAIFRKSRIGSNLSGDQTLLLYKVCYKLS